MALFMLRDYILNLTLEIPWRVYFCSPRFFILLLNTAEKHFQKWILCKQMSRNLLFSRIIALFHYIFMILNRNNSLKYQCFLKLVVIIYDS